MKGHSFARGIEVSLKWGENALGYLSLWGL